MDERERAGATTMAKDQPQGVPTATNPLNYRGRIGTLYRIWLLNLFLTIITFGIYSFWGRTRMRRYAASTFELGDDNLEYTGTGGELFRGFLYAVPIILILYLPLIVYPVDENPAVSLVFVAILFFVFVGIYAALRYRLSRTTWRGIRGRLTGSALKYGALMLGLYVVNILTLGLAIAWSDRVAIGYLMRNVWFGNSQGKFDRGARGLWPVHLLTWLLVIPTFGISRFWYRAAVTRFQYNNLSVGRIQFNADHTGANIFGLVVVNAFILLFTLGLGRPITVHRELKFISTHLSFSGDLETAATEFAQSSEQLASSGEGLDGIFAADSGLF
jgi:uncharacterized membrane protein YjgN (DUF898 family)